MSCTISSELTAYLDGELPIFQVRQIEGHLANCRECRSTVQLLRRTVAQLAELPAFGLPTTIRRAVLSRIDEQARGSIESRLKALWLPQVALPSLGLVLAAIIALVMPRGTGLQPHDVALFEVGANLEIAEDYEVLGLSNLDDLEVVQHLHELEGSP
jgi:anti-sigma factor RsiW